MESTGVINILHIAEKHMIGFSPQCKSYVPSSDSLNLSCDECEKIIETDKNLMNHMQKRILERSI